MKILNLFGGLGGNRRTWSSHEVTTIEIDSNIAKLYSELFPSDKIIVGDYEEYLRDKTNDLDFDFIWGSPPCQSHSHMQVFTRHNKLRQPIPRLDQILGLIVWLKRNFPGFYCIENVIPSYGVINMKETHGINHIILDRHLFYSNFKIRKKKFKSRGSKGHGKIAGLMRMDLDQLLDFHQLPIELGPKIFGLQETGHDHLKVLRNLCNLEIGDYILSELIRNNENNLNKFIVQ